ncbi:hypothetical protein P5V15_015621 [Pogonomyrmex californicus]
MDNTKDREKIAKQIAKTSDSIRKKYRALKIGKIAEDTALEKRFKPIVEPLKQIVEKTEESQSIKREAKDLGIKKKREDSDDDNDNDITTTTTTDKDSYWTDVGWLKLTPQSKKQRTTKELEAASDSLVFESTPIQPSKDPSKEPPLFLQKEDVFETKDVSEPSFETTIKQSLQTQQGREALHNQLGPLGQKYVSSLLDDNGKNDTFDRVYGVYFDKTNGAMLGDKKFDVDKNDSIIIDNVRYNGTPGLYELIFKRLPDDAVFTEDDKQTYKSILLTTNAHRRGHSAHNPIKGNRGSKYINIIAPLVSTYGSSGRKKGAGVSNIPTAMKLNDNKIDYVHWDDPNELVDRLRLLDASHRAGNNAHDNEMLSIIEELREAGIIIN